VGPHQAGPVRGDAHPQQVQGADRAERGAVTKCRYCVLFHTESAKLFGATDEEVEEAVHYTKLVAGWSTYINGLQVDYDEFKAQVDRVVEHVKSAA